MIETVNRQETGAGNRGGCARDRGLESSRSAVFEILYRTLGSLSSPWGLSESRVAEPLVLSHFGGFGRAQRRGIRANYDTAPVFSSSPEPATNAVVPSEDIAIGAPKPASPSSPVAVTFPPSSFQVDSERVNSRSRRRPIRRDPRSSAVFPSPERATEGAEIAGERFSSFPDQPSALLGPAFPGTRKKTYAAPGTDSRWHRSTPCYRRPRAQWRPRTVPLFSPDPVSLACLTHSPLWRTKTQAEPLFVVQEARRHGGRPVG